MKTLRGRVMSFDGVSIRLRGMSCIRMAVAGVYPGGVIELVMFDCIATGRRVRRKVVECIGLACADLHA